MTATIYYNVCITTKDDKLGELLVNASKDGDGLFKQFMGIEDLDPSVYESKICDIVDGSYMFKAIFKSDIVSFSVVSSLMDIIEDSIFDDTWCGDGLQVNARCVWDDGYVADYHTGGNWCVAPCSLLDY